MRYRKINNKGSVLREPLSTAVHIKLKIGAVRFYVRFSSADIFLRLFTRKITLFEISFITIGTATAKIT